MLKKYIITFDSLLVSFTSYTNSMRINKKLIISMKFPFSKKGIKKFFSELAFQPIHFFKTLSLRMSFNNSTSYYSLEKYSIEYSEAQIFLNQKEASIMNIHDILPEYSDNYFDKILDESDIYIENESSF